MFRQFFLHLQTELEPWLTRLVSFLDKKPHNSEHYDCFKGVNERLTKFINKDDLGKTTTKQPFQSQHILMNYNEVVSDFPFGVPVLPIMGFGGSFGAQLLQKSVFKGSDTAMVEEVMSDLLKQYSGRSSEDDLTMMGLKRNDSGVVVVAINDLPITVCLSEHGCCEQYYILERGPGGTKGSSVMPKLSSSYCHPVPHYDFMTEQASLAIHTFKKRVDLKQWGKDVEKEAALSAFADTTMNLGKYLEGEASLSVLADTATTLARPNAPKKQKELTNAEERVNNRSPSSYSTSTATQSTQQ
jgi:hypothetical protein